MDIINKDKLFKQCKDYWAEHKEIFMVFWKIKNFDEYWAMISKQADVFLAIPDHEKDMFMDSHMKMTEKTFRDIGRAINKKYDIKKGK
jgi:hypothetical protein